MRIHLLLFCTVALISQNVIAEDLQSLDALSNKVKDYLYSQLNQENKDELKITTDALDSRLQLKQCQDDKLEVINPYNAALTGNLTLAVRCQEPDNHWTLYIPAHIRMEKQVVTARHPILMGNLIKEDDLQLTAMDTSQLKQGYYTEMSYVVGQVAKQTLNQGNTILPSNLKKSILIHKGQRVSVRAKSDMIQVTVEGIAMEDGGLHDRIRVQNSKSKRYIDGEIVDSKQVQVTL